MYTYKYLQYNEVLLDILDEKRTLINYKIYLDGEIPKSEWKEHSSSTEKWAKHAHLKKLHYPVTVYKKEQPHCFISFSPEFIEVKFLDERMFWFVAMTYKRNLKEGEIFLREVWIREYLYEKEKPLQDLAGDQHLVFTEKGGLTVTKQKIIRIPELKFETENWEADDKVNVSQNWLSEPKFGEYEHLCDFEKVIQPGDLSKPIIPEEIGKNRSPE